MAPDSIAISNLRQYWEDNFHTKVDYAHEFEVWVIMEDGAVRGANGPERQVIDAFMAGDASSGKVRGV